MTPLPVRLVVALAVGLLVTGCGGAAVSTASAIPRIDDTIAIVRAGVALPLAPEEAFSIADDLTATIRVAAVPGVRTVRTLRLALSGTGGPIDDANVQVSGRMRFMDHGSFTVLASSIGDGGYSAVLPFAMAGEWELVISPTLGGVARGNVVVDVTNYN